MPFTIIRNDITKLRVDAIVNAANTRLQRGGGVCGAIFAAAGAARLQAACDARAPIKTGEAVLTPGFALPARYIIHVAGPVYRDGKQGEETLLRSCYLKALGIAVQRKCKSIAFPLISSGIYGYPKVAALRVATEAIRGFIATRDLDVSLVVFDRAAFEVSEELLGAVESYIDEHYVDKHSRQRRRLLEVEREALSEEQLYNLNVDLPFEAAPPQKASVREALADLRLDDLVERLDEPFSATLLRLIDATGKKDAEVYHRANIDRRLFSKIRSKADYAPSKPTVLALAIALELSLAQTGDLLERAGFALSPSKKFDVIVQYFIANRKYDIYEINEVLFSYDQPLLGG